MPYWRIAYFQLGKAASRSQRVELESETEREKERTAAAAAQSAERKQLGCYLSVNLNMATKLETVPRVSERARQMCDK